MKIAIPVVGGELSPHFGQCEGFVIFEADEAAGSLSLLKTIPNQGQARGFLPGWLATLGVNVVIANGMGERARGLLSEQGVRVFTTVSRGRPEEIARAFLAGSLEESNFTCEGGHGHGTSCR